MDKYYFTIDGCKKHFNAFECFTLEDATNTLIEDYTDYAEETLSDLYENNPVLIRAVGDGFCWNEKDNAQKYINKVYSGKFTRMFNPNDEEINTFHLSNIYSTLLYWFLDEENGEIRTCELWSNQLQRFIDEGEWQLAMLTKDGDMLKNSKEWPMPAKNKGNNIIWTKDSVPYQPIMWYGIPDKPILSRWTMKKTGWRLFS